MFEVPLASRVADSVSDLEDGYFVPRSDPVPQSFYFEKSQRDARSITDFGTGQFGFNRSMVR